MCIFNLLHELKQNGSFPVLQKRKKKKKSKPQAAFTFTKISDAKLEILINLAARVFVVQSFF